MTPRTIQLVKEGRLVFWPWLLLVSGALLCIPPIWRIGASWTPLDLRQFILPVGCFLGIPFLAALPFGSEFQYGTIASLLAQPVDRREIWRQKIAVTFASAISAVALYVLANRAEPGGMPDFWMAAAWMIATTAAGSACTLIAKSSIGGLALSSGSFWILFVGWNRLSDHWQKNGAFPAAFLWITAIALFCYCAGAIFLGRRLFLRLQAVDGFLGSDVLAPSARTLPALNFGWLQPRSRGPILNLIRRELYLLRLVWLLGLASIFAWIALLAFGTIRRNDSDFGAMPVVFALLLGLLIALLAGALSLGEEKNQGTHAWQLTLPLSTSTQWLIKLFVALSTSVICAVCMPLGVLLLRGWFAGAPSSYLGSFPVWAWFAQATAVTLIAFYCSCIVTNTVRAVLSFFPLLFALGIAFTCGYSLGYGAIERAPLLEPLLARLDPFRVNRQIASVLDPGSYVPVLVLVGPLLAAGLIQSHRMFRAQMEERKLHAVRCMLFPVAMLLTFSFLLISVSSVAFKLRQEQADIVREAHVAIEELVVNPGTRNAPRVQTFAFADLAKAAQLSEQTRYWLRGSSIVVRPEVDGTSPSSLLWPYESAFVAPGAPGKNAVSYSATIRTPRGSECNLRFWASRAEQTGFFFQSCQ